MKNLVKIISFIGIVIIAQSCGLLGESDDFSCEKNAPLKQGGKNICATAIVDDFKQDTVSPSEYMKIRFIHGTGGFEITISTVEIESSSEYSYPGEVGFWFAEINKSDSGTLTITNLDRTNRTISGQYDLTAEGASNFQAYQYQVVGSFTNVNF